MIMTETGSVSPWTREDAERYCVGVRRCKAMGLQNNHPDAISWTAGYDVVFRALRDIGRERAIDLISSRLWKLGAETELDAFLETVGMDREGEPTPVQDRPALRDRLSRLWSLDRNGWAATVDGSLDELSDAEIAVILDEAIASILAEEAAV